MSNKKVLVLGGNFAGLTAGISVKHKHGVMIPGPQNHAAKIAFEKYFLWKMRNGYVGMP
jgi:hypothetical protein